MQFHEKKFFDLFDFTSFFAWTFLNVLACCDSTEKNSQLIPRINYFAFFLSLGAWEFIGSDGQLYRTQFVADENGYQPVGEHLPTPPPLPPALQRWEDAKNGLLSGKNKNRQKTVQNDLMIGVASADVLPNLRNAKQLSDLDVEVFSPKIMRFGIIMDQLLHSGPENFKKSRQKLVK